MPVFAKHVRLPIVLTALASGAALVPAAPAGAASTLPDCRGSRPAPRDLLTGQGAIESLAFDARGRLLFTDRTHNALMVVAHRGGRPRVLASGIVDGGGIAFDGKGRIYVGFGNNIANGQAAPAVGNAGLYVVDPRTGRKRVYVRGLSMANGVVRTRNGTFFASDDFRPSLDRVSPRRVVTRAWSAAPYTNGLALGPGERWLYANRSGAPTAILRIDTRTGAFSTWASPPAADGGSFLDGLTRGRGNTLYAAAFGAGEVWRIDGRRRFCALARGSAALSSVAVSPGRRGFPRHALYAAGYAGKVLELRGAAG